MSADTIIIQAKKIAQPKVQEQGDEFSDKIEKNKKMVDKQKQKYEGIENSESPFKEESLEGNNEGKKIEQEEEQAKVEYSNGLVKTYFMDLSLEMLKKKYIFPFNQSLRRRKNILLRDPEAVETNKLPSIQNNALQNIYETKSFQFPFCQLKLYQSILKELQSPIKFEKTDIEEEIKYFCLNFPISAIPMIKKPQECTDSNNLPQQHQQQQQQKADQKKHYNSIIFKEKEVEQAFQLIQSEENIKLIAIFSHFAYWQIFGHINPVELNKLAKQQIFVQFFELITVMHNKFQYLAKWLSLAMPLILLALKAITESIFKNTYKQFFDENIPRDIFLDKMFYLVDSIFDPINICGRFVFLEVNSQALSKKTLGLEKNFIKKRMYGVSPFMDMLISQPLDGNTRAILAKKKQTQRNDPLLKAPKKNSYISSAFDYNQLNEQRDDNVQSHMISKTYNLKMYHIFLNKIRQDNKKVQETAEEY